MTANRVHQSGANGREWYPPHFCYHFPVNGGMGDNHKGVLGQSAANTDTVQSVGSQHVFVLVGRVQDPDTV